jgi:competence protein ComEA
MQSRWTKLAGAAVIVAVVFAAIVTVTRSDRSRDLVLRIEPIEPSDEVTVYVGGAVEDPGLFSLPRGSRLSEALDMAGPSGSADLSALPLASILQDEQSITVPAALEDSDDGVAELDSTIDLTSDSININQASEAELLSLPGIGPALAERIRQRRDTEGPFQSIDELSEISGISDRMVSEIREHATVGH